jgi:hypothetical protein
MGETKLGKEVIARLVSKLGSVEKAAVSLSIRPGLVQRFLEGQSPVPDAVLLRALDAMADPATPALRPESAPPKGRPVI